MYLYELQIFHDIGKMDTRIFIAMSSHYLYFSNRLEQERKKQAEMERLLEKQRQIEQQKEEERRKAMEQREVSTIKLLERPFSSYGHFAVKLWVS